MVIKVKLISLMVWWDARPRAYTCCTLGLTKYVAAVGFEPTPPKRLVP